MNGGGAGILAALIAGAALVGCGSDSDAAPVSVAVESSAGSAKTSVDAGGHPLSSATDDVGTMAFETELLRLVNEYRVSRGLAPLTDSGALRAAARAHSQHMALHGFFSHTSPEGLSPAERLTLVDIPWTSVGENIAAGYTTPQAVFDAWLASPGHRQNIESEAWTHAGVGYALDGSPTEESPHVHYWTQNFIRR
jgi:uncharacterized protein YkwD